MSDDYAQSILKRARRSFSSTERNNQETRWSELSEFILPSQSGIFEGKDTPGGKKTQRLYDSHAIQSNHDLAAAIHATLTNPATRWSKLRYKSDELNNDKESLVWLEEVNKTIHETLNESNFDMQVSMAYLGFPALGTMALFHESDPDNPTGFRFKALHLSEIAFSENHMGIVDRLYRKFEMTAEQIESKWPDHKAKVVRDCLKDNPDKKFKIYHCLGPRDKKKVDMKSDLAEPKKRPYESLYVLESGSEILEEGGYYEFPIYVVRWQTLPGEVYGRGPGDTALPTIRSMNRLKELDLQVAAKNANPPFLAGQRGVIGQLDMRPGSVSIVRDINQIREMVVQKRLDISQYTLEDFLQQIRSIFFLDKLQLPPRTETGEMTAFEIQQRVEQMQRVIGPTLSRLNSEFLTPLIVRCFKVLLRNGALPNPPELVQRQGINIDILFLNPLSRSQRIEEVTSTQALLQDVGLLSQLNPEIIDYIDFDQIVKHTAKIRGVPEIIIRPDSEVQELRQQRAQAQQRQQQMQEAIAMADINSKTNQGGNDGPAQ